MIEIDKELVRKILPERKQNSNKGDFGKVLCITGSDEYIGAGLLSSLAVLKTGCGYSILCSENKAIEHYKNYSPDLIYKSHENFDFSIIKNIIEEMNINSIVYGCGIGANKTTLNLTNDFLYYARDNNLKVIVDADGLNCLAKLDDMILNNNFILTPHPAELGRLLNISTNDIQSDREKYLQIAASKYNANIVLKGHNTLISDKTEIYSNKTGNSALAKAGTGDVLAGMIGAFLSQNISPLNASISGVYIHGLSADIYAKEYCEYTMLASDLLNYIPKAFKDVLC